MKKQKEYFIGDGLSVGRGHLFMRQHIDGKIVTMTIGVVLEKYGVAPLIIDNRTYVPIRFVAEELGASVEWNESTKEIVITK